MPDLLVVAEDRMIANNLTKLRPRSFLAGWHYFSNCEVAVEICVP